MAGPPAALAGADAIQQGKQGNDAGDRHEHGQGARSNQGRAEANQRKCRVGEDQGGDRQGKVFGLIEVNQKVGHGMHPLVRMKEVFFILINT